jgi:hypothetical protein
MYANGSNGTSVVSARSLINNRTLSKTRRALLGAAVKAGGFNLRLTNKQIAAAVGCSVAYLQAAQKLTPAERQAAARRDRLECHA